MSSGKPGTQELPNFMSFLINNSEGHFIKVGIHSDYWSSISPQIDDKKISSLAESF